MTLAEKIKYQIVDRSDLEIQQAIEHAASLLPAQGPITVFVHHNTLHAFEHLNFDQAVQEGGRLFGCHAYLPESDYWKMFQRGRIRREDLEAVLLEDLDDEADRLVSVFCTQYGLRLSMLLHFLYSGSESELRWVVAESNALQQFREDVTPRVRVDLLKHARKVCFDATADQAESYKILNRVLQSSAQIDRGNWSDREWTKFVLNYLWRVCVHGIEQVAQCTGDGMCCDGLPLRHRDVLLAAGGTDADEIVHETLIRFCAAFLDQGFANWSLPDREHGFFMAFLRLHAGGLSPTHWQQTVRGECRRLLNLNFTPIESIAESLRLLGVGSDQLQNYIAHSLLALRGWAGMIWQMETNAEWTLQSASPGSLEGFLAVRLMLDRISLARVACDLIGATIPINEIHVRFKNTDQLDAPHQLQQRAFTVFQLAQILGWRPGDLEKLAPQQWEVLVREIESFHSLERRRTYHHAYERKYRNEALDAIIAHNRVHKLENHSNSVKENRDLPWKNFLSPMMDDSIKIELEHHSLLFQLVTCIDDREESLRRHVEELTPSCQTYGIAGFFGIPMYYRGLGQAHFRPLSPISIKPQHYVREEPNYSQIAWERQRSAARKHLGRLGHGLHLASRSFWGGVIAGIAGLLAAFPLVGRVLFPRLIYRMRKWFGKIIVTPATELQIECNQAGESEEKLGQNGFSLLEMADIVELSLRSSGLQVGLSRLVIFLGHGSTSLNNPHESAYNCGACAGSRGGPNARAFAMMANDYRVRRLLADRNLIIPDSTVFVGGYHDTADDSIMYYDVDRLPVSHRCQFEQAEKLLTVARKRNAHERCRRFETVSQVALQSFTVDDALYHVCERTQDLSQTRPEYNHATNALCLVGRRRWSRNLFLDRRAFLASYDPSIDDDQGTILAKLLAAVVPVCAGISLEYYFSCIDVEGYGCGSKLPHNITSLLGVMSGAASDLRPGLSQQMVEIHEPMRILFVVETLPAVLQRIIDHDKSLAKLVEGGWVQLAVFNPDTAAVHRFVQGEFVIYAPHERKIPTAATSRDWYDGHCEHLGFASILSGGNDRFNQRKTDGGPCDT